MIPPQSCNIIQDLSWMVVWVAGAEIAHEARIRVAEWEEGR